MARTPTTIEKVRGDQKAWRITVTDTATPVPAAIDLTGAVVRFTVKRNSESPLSEAILALATYDAEQIQITDAVNGEVVVTVCSGLDSEAFPGEYCWDLETIRLGVLKKSSPGDGTVAVLAGSGVMVFSDATVPAAAAIGSLLVPAGGSAPNQITVAVIATPADDSSLAANELLTDYQGWVDESGIGYALHKGNVKTPDRLFGVFVLHKDVT